MTTIYLRYPVDGIDVLNVGLDGYRKLDLYKDENMEFISKVSDINKLDRVFSDFSNSFSVPATPNNNELFRYYFDVDVAVEYAYNSNIKVDCYIEISGAPYRFAALQLESVKTKDGRFDSYSIGIFSAITQLTDLFGEDTIAELDKDKTGATVYDGLSQYNYLNSNENYMNAINNQAFNNGATLMPMINLSDKKWQLVGTTVASDAVHNVTLPATPIESEDTRPAFRVIHIVEAIEQKYKVKFSRDFFARAEFMNLFMWMNIAEEFTNTDYIHMPITVSFIPNPIPPNPQVPGDVTITASNDIAVRYLNNISNVGGITKKGTAGIQYTIIPGTGWTNKPYSYKIIDENGKTLAENKSVKGTRNPIVDLHAILNDNSNKYITKTLRLEIKASDQIPFTINVLVKTGTIDTGNGTYAQTITNNVVSNGNITTTINNIIIADNLPDMKVTEFMQNIMKMFKLVIRPLALNPSIPGEENGSFYLTTLNSYYLHGETKDLTQNIDFDDITIKRPEIFKELSFKYAKTENVTGKFFRDNNIQEIGYGDVKIQFPEDKVNSKSKLEVAISWENMFFERLTTIPLGGTEELTNFMIGESIATDDAGITFTKNMGKTLLFYNMGIQYLNNVAPKIRFPASGTPTIVPVRYYSLFGNSNDADFNQVTQSINFDPAALYSDLSNDPGNFQLDPWHYNVIQNGLYWTKWKNWIDEIYDFRQRKFAYKAVGLGPQELTTIDLSDTIVIKDQKYKIEDMKLNLSTGDAALNLFRTFRVTEIPTPFTPFEFSTESETRTGDPLHFADYNSTASDVILYGNFQKVGDIISPYLVKLDIAGAVIPEFNVGSGFTFTFNEPVFEKIKRIGDDLYVCGSISSYNGIEIHGLVKMSAITGAIDTTFTSNIGTGFNEYVHDVIDAGDGIIVIGSFLSFNSVTHLRIVKLNYDGTLFPGFSGSFDNGFALSIIKVIIGGNTRYIITHDSNSYNGTTCKGIVMIDEDGAFVSSFGAGIDVDITSIPFLENASDNPDDTTFWVFGDIEDFNGIPVNHIALVNATTEEVIPATIPLGGPDGLITFGKRVLGDKLLIQGQGSTGFTKYDGVDSKAIILTSNGEFYYGFTGKNIFVYSAGEQFYVIDLDSKTVSPAFDDNIPFLNRIQIIANPGQMYYGVTIQKLVSWTATKVDVGYGTSWLKFISNKEDINGLDVTTGVGLDECTFLISNRTLEAPPVVFNDRFMKIKFTFETGDVILVDIIQKGIVDVIALP